MNARIDNRHKLQKGMLLIEALIAIAIFSLGILGILGLQTSSAKQSGDAKFRSDASFLGEELIGKMWVTDRTYATLVSRFQSPDGTDYVAWLGDASSPASGTVRALLPGADVSPPTVTITPENQVKVQISWKAPYEAASAAVHKYTVTAQIQ